MRRIEAAIRRLAQNGVTDAPSRLIAIDDEIEAIMNDVARLAAGRSSVKDTAPSSADVAFLLQAAAREEAKSRNVHKCGKRELANKCEDRADRFVAIAKRFAAFVEAERAPQEKAT